MTQPTVTRAEIATRTGLPESTISRHLRRFPAARLKKGVYDLAHPQFASWLSYQQSGQSTDTAERPPSGGLDRQHWILPSGLPLPASLYERLRGDETRALDLLDRLIARYQLPPHPAVPDLLPFIPRVLPSGTIINDSQLRILRTGTERAAGVALDVLLRSYEMKTK